MNKETEKLMIEKLMHTALDLATISKCAAKKVCCILYKDGNVISIGINGTKSGNENCCDRFEKIDGLWYEYGKPCKDQTKHHSWSLLHEIHSEVNSLAKAKTNTEGAYAIVTHSPCFNCCKTLLAFGITKIFYHYEYDDINDIKNVCKEIGIDLIKI